MSLIRSLRKEDDPHAAVTVRCPHCKHPNHLYNNHPDIPKRTTHGARPAAPLIRCSECKRWFRYWGPVDDPQTLAVHFPSDPHD